MRTITFYSYKGGVGRSLLVANAAKYLSILGKSVIALDFDLEAPGLHYKFALGQNPERSEASPGIVDILYEFVHDGILPHSLTNYTVELPVSSDAGPIRMMRAGTAPHGDYWRKLSQINWYDLFYGPQPTGTPFFLELQERIRRDFNPDFCLIDARTGITDMGGVATTLLPDTVVCLGLDSTEHLDGLRAVMQGVKQTTTHQGANVTLVPVISRLAHRDDQSDEEEELTKILDFLNTPVREGLPSLGLGEVLTLHSEPILDSAEQLLVGGSSSPHDLPLLRDYLRLFSQIIPGQEIRPHVGRLIQQAIGRLLDDPDGAQSDLETLTTYCADQEAYRALLKLYRVRKAPLEKELATAAVMWQLRSAEAGPDPLLVDVVRLAYSDQRPTELQKKYSDFAEDIWRSSAAGDAQLALGIANSFLPDRRDKAVQMLTEYVEKAEVPSFNLIARLIDLARGTRSVPYAYQLIERYKKSAEGNRFHVVWAQLVVAHGDSAKAQEVLKDPSFRVDAVRRERPAVLYRLLKLSGSSTQSSVLREALENTLANRDFPNLEELAEVFQDEGRFEEFQDAVRGQVPEGFLEHLTEMPPRRLRRYRSSY